MPVVPFKCTVISAPPVGPFISAPTEAPLKALLVLPQLEAPPYEELRLLLFKHVSGHQTVDLGHHVHLLQEVWQIIPLENVILGKVDLRGRVGQGPGLHLLAEALQELGYFLVAVSHLGVQLLEHC